MKIIKVKNYDEMSQAAFEIILEVVKNNFLWRFYGSIQIKKKENAEKAW